MIDEGDIFHYVEVDNWFDCGKKDIILETNKTLLQHNQYDKRNTFIEYRESNSALVAHIIAPQL